LGLALAALGVFVAVEGGAVAGAQTYARVGPEVFPRLVGAGLALVGALLAFDAWRRRLSVEWAAPASATGRRQDELRLLGRVLLMAFGLALSAALMQPAGFIAATTTLFLCVTIAFGSRAPIRDLAIGLVFTASVFLIFTMGLGLSLPWGRLWRP
jgi:putative tricarboxylic transport membrane protein